MVLLIAFRAWPILRLCKFHLASSIHPIKRARTFFEVQRSSNPGIGVIFAQSNVKIGFAAFSRRNTSCESVVQPPHRLLKQHQCPNKKKLYSSLFRFSFFCCCREKKWVVVTKVTGVRVGKLMLSIIICRACRCISQRTNMCRIRMCLCVKHSRQTDLSIEEENKK